MLVAHAARIGRETAYRPCSPSTLAALYAALSQPRSGRLRQCYHQAMSEDLVNFKAWYEDVLTALYPNPNAGIAALMLSLPLGERFLRQKNHVAPGSPLTDACMVSLIAIVPELRDIATARQFWAVYRHGFLHQATLSATAGGVSLPVGWLTHTTAAPFEIRRDGSFQIHPVLLSQAIVRAIRAEFDVFAGTAAGAPALPRIVNLDPVTIPSTYQGTGNRP